MNVVVVRDQHRPNLGGNLNVRQLFGPLFFSTNRRHPDMTRQRKARLKALALRQARELKMMEVPLRLVDSTIYLERDECPIIEICKSWGSAYRRRVRQSCVEVRRVEC